MIRKLNIIQAQQVIHLKTGGMVTTIIKKNNENGTELSKYIWKLKNNNIKYNIKLSIIHHTWKQKNSREYAEHVTWKRWKLLKQIETTT